MGTRALPRPDLSPSRAVRERVRPADLALLVSIPILLGGVYLLPAGVRQSLAFRYRDPSLLTALAAPYVHLHLPHLLANVVGYLLVATLAYLLSVVCGRRGRFYAAFATFTVAFPVVLSYMNLVFVRPAAGLGFSGVVMAFVGYLALALAEYLDERFRVGPTRAVGPVLFFLGIALIAVLSVRTVRYGRATVTLGTAGLVLAAVLSAALYWLYARDQRRRPDRRGVASVPGNLELAAGAALVFVAFPFVAFPPDPFAPGETVNFYVHLLGFALGFIVTYLAAEVERRHLDETDDGGLPRL